MKFLIIYSDGPTGSSTLASLFEKYGFINLPFRKFNLSEYVMGVKSLSDKTMQLKFLDRIDKLSVPARSGGVSVNDRNRRKEIIRTNKPTKKEIDEFLSFEPSNLESLISHCFLFTSKFIIYKNNIPSPRGFIIQEMPQFKIKHSFTEYEYIKKLNKLDSFIFFITHRDFKSWCSALLSQQDSKLSRFSKLNLISLEKLYLRWLFIKKLVKDRNICSININSILLPNTEETNKLISKKIGLKNINLRTLINVEFDMYGSILKFNEAFTPSDLSFKKSNFIAKIILTNYSNFPYPLRIIFDYFFNALRLLKLLRF